MGVVGEIQVGCGAYIVGGEMCRGVVTNSTIEGFNPFWGTRRFIGVVQGHYGCGRGDSARM